MSDAIHTELWLSLSVSTLIVSLGPRQRQRQRQRQQRQQRRCCWRPVPATSAICLAIAASIGDACQFTIFTAFPLNAIKLQQRLDRLTSSQQSMIADNECAP